MAVVKCATNGGATALSRIIEATSEPHSILGEFTTASENRKSKSIALIDLNDIIVNMTNVDVGNDCSIQKHVLHAGKGNIPSFIDGTKVLEIVASLFTW